VNLKAIAINSLRDFFRTRDGKAVAIITAIALLATAASVGLSYVEYVQAAHLIPDLPVDSVGRVCPEFVINCVENGVTGPNLPPPSNSPFLVRLLVFYSRSAFTT
jgi:hypothetical protein